jgi:hypothetical protein
MNINENMNYSEKITEFIDGELSQEESSALFSKLAENPELQEELRNSLLLKNMFHQELLTPPPLAKTHLYAKLNLQRSAIILSFLITALLNLKKLLMAPAFTSALIGVSLFTLGLLMTGSNENSKSSLNQRSGHKFFSMQDNDSKNANIVPLVSSKELLTNDKSENKSRLNNRSKKSQSSFSNISDSFANISKVKNPDNNNNFENVENSEKKNTTNNFEEKQSNIIFLPIETSNFNSKFSLNFINNRNANFFSSLGYEISSILESISLSVNKTASSSQLKTSLEPLSNPLLNNYSIAISYTLDKNNSFSVELGQENFPQSFAGKINGYEANITQVFTAQWYGISYQYNFGEITSLYSINPFGKLLISGTSIGPFYKGSLGLTYQLTEKIALQGAVEASRLSYSFQNTWFSTDKYGFLYGVKIGF